MRRVGNGELVAASQQSFLLNEAIKTHPNPALLEFIAGGRPVVWVDETLHGLHQDQGVLWLVQRYRLQAALLLFWATLLALLWSMSGDLVRRPTRNWDAHIMRHSEGAEVAARRLLQRSIATRRGSGGVLGRVSPPLAAGCAGYFCRSTERPTAARGAGAASSSGLQPAKPVDCRATRIR